MAWKDMKVMDDRARRQRKKAEMIRKKIEEEKKLKEEIRKKTVLVSMVVMALVGLAIGFFIMVHYKEEKQITESKNRILIKDLKGTVEVKSEFKNFPVDLKKDDKIKENSTIYVKKSGKIVLELADKSRIILYENSILTINKLHFDKNNNRIEVNLNLEDGNAVFDIKKNHEKYEIHNLFVKAIPISKGPVLFKAKSDKIKSKQTFVIRSGKVNISDSMNIKNKEVSAGQKIDISFENGVDKFSKPKACNIALEGWY